MQDTNKMVEMNSYWLTGTSVGKVYDISENAFPEAQFVAQLFIRDMETHYLKTSSSSITFAGPLLGMEEWCVL